MQPDEKPPVPARVECGAPCRVMWDGQGWIPECGAYGPAHQIVPLCGLGCVLGRLRRKRIEDGYER